MGSDDIHISIKFPNGMSDRDKQIILQMLRDEMAKNPPQTEAEATIRIRAFCEEHLVYGTREIDP